MHCPLPSGASPRARTDIREGKIDEKADQLLEMMTPDNQDFVDRKLARLRREKQGAQTRLEDLVRLDFKPPDIEATVDAILAQLKDFPRVAAQGTVEERKQFVRLFVESIRIRPETIAGAATLKSLPIATSFSDSIPLENLSSI